jgi:serine/threonine protein kinase
MEHLEGGSLASMIERLGRLSLQEAAEVTYQIAMALDYIHSKGIVHLNVHPQNVFFRYPLPDPNPRVERSGGG